MYQHRLPRDEPTERDQRENENNRQKRTEKKHQRILPPIRDHPPDLTHQSSSARFGCREDDGWSHYRAFGKAQNYLIQCLQ